MPATLKAAAAAARWRRRPRTEVSTRILLHAFLHTDLLPLFRVIQEKAEMEAKWLKEHDGTSKPPTKELAAHEMPSAPRNT